MEKVKRNRNDYSQKQLRLFTDVKEKEAVEGNDLV